MTQGIELELSPLKVLDGLQRIERQLKQVDDVVNRLDRDLRNLGDADIRRLGDASDEARREMDRLNRAVEDMQRQLRELQQQADRARQDLDRLDGSSCNTGQGMNSLALKIGAGIAALAGIAVGVGAAVEAFTKYDDTMRRTAVITGATGEAVDRMRELVLEMGSTTTFSASQAAEAMQNLGMAGLSAEESMVALPEVLNLAAAGMLDIGSAADISTNILTGYGFTAEDLVRVNDNLAQASRSANTDIQQLGQGFSFVGPIAASAGQEFETTTGLLALLANAGFKAERGGTALRGALSRLLNPTAKASETLKRLEVDVKNTDGSMRGMDEILIDLGKSTDDTADILKIFGVIAGPAMVSVIGQGEGAIRAMIERMRESEGTAKEVADALTGSLSVSLAGLSSAAEGFGIAFIDALDQDFAGLLDGISDAIRAMTKVVSQNEIELKLLIGVLGGLVIAKTMGYNDWHINYSFDGGIWCCRRIARLSCFAWRSAGILGLLPVP